MERKIKLPYMDPEIVSKEIGYFIVQKTLEFQKNGGILGLSGGIDSSTTASLAKRAYDNYNQTRKEKLELFGYVLPSNVNNPKDAEDAVRVANFLGINYETVGIEPLVNAYEITNPEAMGNPRMRGNMMSRMRAGVLLGKSESERKILLGTGNKDEDFGVGYYTLFGDGAVHISPIGGLSKRLVKEMAHYLGLDYDLVQREPTAGLEIGQTDFKDLGYTYEAAELVIEGLGQGFAPFELKKNNQINELVGTFIQRSKFSSVDEVVEDIIARHETAALPKGKLVTPEMPKITLRYE